MESSGIVQVDTLDILVVDDIFDAGLVQMKKAFWGEPYRLLCFENFYPRRDWKAQMIIFTLMLTNGQRTEMLTVILKGILKLIMDLAEVSCACLGPELISPDFVYRVYRDHKKPQYFFLNCGD